MFVLELTGIQRLLCSQKKLCEMFVLKLSVLQKLFLVR